MYFGIILAIYFCFVQPLSSLSSNSQLNALENETQFALRPAHLEAIPIERDGALNKEYRREIILGEDTQDAVGTNKNKGEHAGENHHEITKLIREMFQRADVNSDDKLNASELLDQITANTNHHLEDARRESEKSFQIVDENGDGKITWNEYKMHLLAEDSAKKRPDAIHPRDLASKQKLTAEKEAFKYADAEDDGLEETEWLGFRHPENSEVMLHQMAKNVLSAYDEDKDGRLTAEEFAKPEDDKADDGYREERIHEFNTLIDKNNDGYADLEELAKFADPRNPQNAVNEVHDLFTLVDGNRDGYLTLDELLARSDLLGASAFIHAGVRLHDDL